MSDVGGTHSEGAKFRRSQLHSSLVLKTVGRLRLLPEADDSDDESNTSSVDLQERQPDEIDRLIARVDGNVKEFVEDISGLTEATTIRSC